MAVKLLLDYKNTWFRCLPGDEREIEFMHGVGRDVEKPFEWTTFASLGMDDHLAHHNRGDNLFILKPI